MKIQIARLLQLIGGGTVLAVVLCAIVYAFFLWIVPNPPPVANYGHFEVDGKPAEYLTQIFPAPGAARFPKEENWTPTDWDAKLGNELTYIDPQSLHWHVPRGQINDGATVPKILHSIVSGGHNGLFLGAAVVHDRFCQKEDARTELGVGFPEVHRMFYYAMRASDVSESTSKVMYGAVCCFGPP